MGETISKRPDFKPQSSRAMNGIALIFDLGGFSKFFNQPDVHTYIPIYLNHVRRCVETIFLGSKTGWRTGENQISPPLIPLPVHRKFLGDGFLYIWTPKKDSDELTNAFVQVLCADLWKLQKDFYLVNRACSDDVPVYELPETIRFGLARGTVFELSMEKTKSREYIGVCINLASRLQKYCPGLNFLASARLGFPERELSAQGYTRIVATKIKGFPKEILIVDREEYEALPEETRADLFMDI